MALSVGSDLMHRNPNNIVEKVKAKNNEPISYFIIGYVHINKLNNS